MEVQLVKISGVHSHSNIHSLNLLMGRSVSGWHLQLFNMLSEIQLVASM